MRARIVLTVVAGVLFSGCTQVKVFTPQPAPTRVTLTGMPSARVMVEVNDLRSGQGESDGLAVVLRGQVESALSNQEVASSATKLRLLIDVVEHRSFFTTGNWNAETRLRIRLLDAHGVAIGGWEAKGTGRRSNMFGYESARAVAQDSYNSAVSDLLSSLSSVQLPP